jgi:phosphatidylglycerol:prolipoprotein diacylglycerol transferase
MSEFLSWWQHLPENMNPVIFKIGGFSLHYYGLMYLVAFGVVYAMASYRVKREKEFLISVDEIQDLMVFMMIGVIVGGRLGYVLIYNPAYYLKHPLETVLPFNFSHGFTFTGISGMSFHGGLIGVLVAIGYFTRKTGTDFWNVADLFVPIIPLGYTFGRIGNFINGELYGRVTTSSIGMYFPAAPGPNLRYPSKRSSRELFYLLFYGICGKSENPKAPCSHFTLSATAYSGSLSNISASRTLSSVLSFYRFPWGRSYAAL